MATRRLLPEEVERLATAEPDLLEPITTSSLVPLLASLDRGLLAGLMAQQRYEAGDVVFREGAPGDAAYLIWSGRVAVVRGELASPTVLGYRGPGQVVGEMALLEGRPRSASVVALETLRLLRIGRQAFQRLLSTQPAISTGIMASLSARLREADDVREAGVQATRKLSQQVSALQTERDHLLELQQVRQETSDLIIHDLRGPLGSISAAIQMLEMVLPPDVLEANRQLLDIAGSGCERMQRLVDSLLDVARLESGETQLRLVPTDLRHLVQEALTREALTLQDRQIRACLSIPASLPAVPADAERIDRVLGNLIDNAIKYTPRQGELIIAAEVQGDEVVVSVTDSGPGIPPEERERIFERFTRLSRDRGRRRGFGLGLAFCRLAVEAHGGHIWVEEGEGGAGSRFSFTLPLSSRA